MYSKTKERRFPLCFRPKPFVDLPELVSKCPVLIEPREEVKLRSKQCAGEAVEDIYFEKRCR